uniref:Uncharacterized protein n=1 Tax=Triticum urartu TaxID=4572 RepID=A0A8R7NXA9_TRIUA
MQMRFQRKIPSPFSFSIGSSRNAQIKITVSENLVVPVASMARHETPEE